MAKIFFLKENTSVLIGKDVEKTELSYSAGGSVTDKTTLVN